MNYGLSSIDEMAAMTRLVSNMFSLVNPMRTKSPDSTIGSSSSSKRVKDLWIIEDTSSLRNALNQ